MKHYTHNEFVFTLMKKVERPGIGGEDSDGSDTSLPAGPVPVKPEH
jgi:hypothetical protein